MIQLSDYDYPIVINPQHFHHYFKALGDQEYMEVLKMNLFFQDFVKSLIQFEKNDQVGLLSKK